MRRLRVGRKRDASVLLLSAACCAALCPCGGAQTPAVAPAVSAFAQVKSAEEYKTDAWAALMGSLQDMEHKDVRVQALAALGLLGDNSQAVGLIQASLVDPEKEIRLAAVLASGEAKAPVLNDALHATLADADATVAFSAARVLARRRTRRGRMCCWRCRVGRRERRVRRRRALWIRQRRR